MAVDFLQKIVPFSNDFCLRGERRGATTDLTGRKIMVVDDDEDFRFLVCDRLERRGLSCIEAENGKVAKDHIAGNHVDLVITDNHMPVTNGLELIEWLQETQRYMPVILVSGDISMPIRERAKEAGVYACIEKPCSLAGLSSKVEEILKEF